MTTVDSLGIPHSILQATNPTFKNKPKKIAIDMTMPAGYLHVQQTANGAGEITWPSQQEDPHSGSTTEFERSLCQPYDSSGDVNPEQEHQRKAREAENDMSAMTAGHFHAQQAANGADLEIRPSQEDPRSTTTELEQNLSQQYNLIGNIDSEQEYQREGREAEDDMSAGHFRVQQAVTEAGGIKASQEDSHFITQFEQDLWQEYGLIGDVDPEYLLKECQRKAREAISEIHQPSAMWTLTALDGIHKTRKQFSHSVVLGQESISPEVEEALPNDQSKAIDQHFWAVLIGNNKYTDMKELYGEIGLAQ